MNFSLTHTDLEDVALNAAIALSLQEAQLADEQDDMLQIAIALSFSDSTLASERAVSSSRSTQETRTSCIAEPSPTQVAAFSSRYASSDVLDDELKAAVMPPGQSHNYVPCTSASQDVGRSAAMASFNAFPQDRANIAAPSRHTAMSASPPRSHVTRVLAPRPAYPVRPTHDSGFSVLPQPSLRPARPHDRLPSPASSLSSSSSNSSRGQRSMSSRRSSTDSHIDTPPTSADQSVENLCVGGEQACALTSLKLKLDGVIDYHTSDRYTVREKLLFLLEYPRRLCCKRCNQLITCGQLPDPLPENKLYESVVLMLHARCSACNVVHCVGCGAQVSCGGITICGGNRGCQVANCCRESRAIALYEVLYRFDAEFLVDDFCARPVVPFLKTHRKLITRTLDTVSRLLPCCAEDADGQGRELVGYLFRSCMLLDFVHVLVESHAMEWTLHTDVYTPAMMMLVDMFDNDLQNVMYLPRTCLLSGPSPSGFVRHTSGVRSALVADTDNNGDDLEDVTLLARTVHMPSLPSSPSRNVFAPSAVPGVPGPVNQQPVIKNSIVGSLHVTLDAVVKTLDTASKTATWPAFRTKIDVLHTITKCLSQNVEASFR